MGGKIRPLVFGQAKLSKVFRPLFFLSRLLRSKRASIQYVPYRSVKGDRIKETAPAS